MAATSKASATTAAMTQMEAWNPIHESNRLPRKNPTPFSAFLLPVSSATQR
jgi:hypothetical protein